MKVVFKCISGAVIYLLAQVISGLIWPLKEELLNGVPVEEAWFSLPAILISGLIFSFILYFFSVKSRLPIGKRIVVLTLFFYFTVIFMSQIETLYFREAFPLIDNITLVQFFVNNLISSFIYVPLLLLVFNHKNKQHEREDYSGKNNPLLIILLAVVYVGVYLLFGRFVAYSSETLIAFYAGWESLEILNRFLIPFQLLRGFMWVTLAWLGINQFKKANDAVIGISIFYSLCLSVLLLMPNSLMPKEVRFYHGMEVFLSMLLYGYVCGITLTGKLSMTNTK